MGKSDQGMRWSVEDELLLVDDEYRTKRGLFEMDKQFLKVGDRVFNINNITMIDLNNGEYSNNSLHIKTVDCVEGYYSVKKSSPEGKGLLAWLTDETRCQDVLAPPTDGER